MWGATTRKNHQRNNDEMKKYRQETGKKKSPSSKGTRDFWQELYDRAGLCFDCWCIGGDFDMARWLSERSFATIITKDMTLFNSLIDELNLFDPSLKNGSFTWYSSGDRPPSSKIDRFLLSEGWMRSFKEVCVQASENFFRSLPYTFNFGFAKMGQHSLEVRKLVAGAPPVFWTLWKVGGILFLRRGGPDLHS